MIPWTPYCECSHPSFLGARAFAEYSGTTNQDLFVKLFKSLAPGRAAGGDMELNSYRCFTMKRVRSEVPSPVREE